MKSGTEAASTTSTIGPRAASKPPRLRALGAFVAIVLALPAVIGAGCFNTQSHLQRGEAYATGNPKYDDFFKEVIALRADAERAPSEEVAARQDLVTALGLEAKTDIAQTVGETRDRAKKLRDYGVMLHLELTPDVKLVTAKGKQVDDPPPALVSGVVESTRKSLDLTRHLDDMMRHASDLEKKRVELRGDAQGMFRALPQGQLFVVPGTGHNTFPDRSEWMNAVILSFLDSEIKAAPR